MDGAFADVVSMGLPGLRICEDNIRTIIWVILQVIHLNRGSILMLSSKTVILMTYDEPLKDSTALATSSLAKRSHFSRALPLTLPRSPALSYSMRETLRLTSVY